MAANPSRRMSAAPYPGPGRRTARKEEFRIVGTALVLLYLGVAALSLLMFAASVAVAVWVLRVMGVLS